jgi:phage baseplate assembly protein W
MIEVTGAAAPLVLGATGLEEIIQNVRLILTTTKGSVPLDREFGLTNIFLDQPTPLAKTAALPEIIAAVEEYEPRVKVTGISWAQSDEIDGVLVPRVRIKVIDNVS